MLDLHLGILEEFSSRNRGLSSFLRCGFDPDGEDVGTRGLHILHLSTVEAPRRKAYSQDRRARGKCQRCSNRAAVVDGKVLARCDACREAHNKRRNKGRNT